MLLSCGDALIDFVPVKAADGRDALVPAVGGSCLNIAVAMARLGAPAGFVGGVSTDLFGQMIAEHMAASKVDLRYVERSARETTLAFVRLVGGEAHYAFYDETTACRMWRFRPGQIPFPAIDALHVGSVPLVNEPSSGEMLKLFDAARGITTLSFDPNCRPTLVADRQAYRARMEAFRSRTDIFRMSDVDFEFLYGDADPDSLAAGWLAAGNRLVVMTRGADGVVAWHARAGRVTVPAPKVAVVDTIGAGDTFQAGLLVALRQADRIDADGLAGLDESGLRDALAFGAAAAAITCTRAGANPPFRHELAG